MGPKKGREKDTLGGLEEALQTKGGRGFGFSRYEIIQLGLARKTSLEIDVAKW